MAGTSISLNTPCFLLMEHLLFLIIVDLYFQVEFLVRVGLSAKVFLLLNIERPIFIFWFALEYAGSVS